VYEYTNTLFGFVNENFGRQGGANGGGRAKGQSSGEIPIKETGIAEISVLNHCFVLCLLRDHEFSTFFKKVGVSPSGGIKVFEGCGMLG